jgi:thiamine pyrophosphokinase
MSSHHIVRDEQEPAVLITEINKRYWPSIQQLLGWVPTVVVVEQCVDEVLLSGIKIDVVICKQANLPTLQKHLLDQQPIQFILQTNKTVIATAIDYLIERAYRGVNIFGGFDQQQSTAINNHITAIWYDINFRYILSNNKQFQKWMVKDHSFRIGSIEKNQSFKLVNIEKSAGDGHYICTSDGTIVIQSNANFWLGESLS